MQRINIQLPTPLKQRLDALCAKVTMRTALFDNCWRRTLNKIADPIADLGNRLLNDDEEHESRERAAR